MSSMYGLGRLLLWWLVKLLATLASAVEGIYNHIFSLAGAIYNEHVIKFIQNWMGFLWIPIALSLVYLGYTLITGNDVDGNKAVKTFGRNLALLLIVIFAIPYIFVGHSNTNKASLFTNTNYSKYEPQNLDGNSGLIDIFTNDEGQGIIKGVKWLSGRTDSSTTQIQAIIAKNLTDLKTIYIDEQLRDANGQNFTTSEPNWYALCFNKTTRQNEFYKIVNASTGDVQVVNGKDILDIEINDVITEDKLNDETFGDDVDTRDKFVLSDVRVSNYDVCALYTDVARRDSVDLRKAAEEQGYDASNIDRGSAAGLVTAYNSVLESVEGSPDDVKVRDYLFKTMHVHIGRLYDSDGKVVGAGYSSNGATKRFMLELTFFNDFPFRYKIEWGTLLIELVSSFIVLFLTSYKIARIMYEIIIDQFLAVFFGAADLSTGQKTREILKSIFGLVLSLFFAVVMVELYFSISDSVSRITFIANDGTNNNHWMQAIASFFIAIAAVKGPSVLEKVLGIEGGLSGAWRDIGTATRPARNVTKGVAKGAVKLATTSAMVGGIMATQHHKGKVAARNANKNGNQDSVVRGRRRADRSRDQTPGNEGQFTAINSAGSGDGSRNVQGGRNGETRQAANNAMARQSRDISEETKKAYRADNSKMFTGDNNVDLVKERYGENIRHAAMAEQAANPELSDKAALKTAYENHGFSASDADAAAKHDVSTGAYSATKERFENSISAKAQADYNADPTKYANMQEAYDESAKAHYKALGFTDNQMTEAVENNARKTSQNVMADDMQETIRDNAQRQVRNLTEEDKSKLVHKNGTPYTDSEIESHYLNLATQEVMRQSSVGFTGDTKAAASRIQEQGTLREGIRTGRIANNMERERAERNTRTGSLGGQDSTMNPAMEAAMLMTGNYFMQRTVQAASGFSHKHGASSYEKKMKKRTNRGKNKF